MTFHCQKTSRDISTLCSRPEKKILKVHEVDDDACHVPHHVSLVPIKIHIPNRDMLPAAAAAAAIPAPPPSGRDNLKPIVVGTVDSREWCIKKRASGQWYWASTLIELEPEEWATLVVKSPETFGDAVVRLLRGVLSWDDMKRMKFEDERFVFHERDPHSVSKIKFFRVVNFQKRRIRIVWPSPRPDAPF